MNYATSTDGVRIAYEVVGHGPPLLLHHGFTGSAEDWRELGYVTALHAEYQLVLMNARGHGHSDKPHDSAAYAMSQRVADVVAVLDALGIESAHFWGYSMGARVGFGVGAMVPHRAVSLILGGNHPYTDPPNEADAFIAALHGGMENWVAAWEQEAGRLAEPFRTRMLANDAAALIADRQARRVEGGWDWALPRMPLPCLLYVGDQDEPPHRLAQQAARQLPQAEFVSLPGLDHLAAMERRDDVLPYVRAFLARVSQWPM